MWLPNQLRLSKKLGPFEGEGSQIFVKIQWYTKVETSTKMTWILIKNRPHDTKKYFFKQNLVFFLKTYSDSTLNTKYESITRKTERDRLENVSGIP